MKKIMVHKKNKWKLKNKLEVENWFSIIFALIFILILINIMR